MATDTIQVTSMNEAPGRILTIARRDFNSEIHSYVNSADEPAPHAVHAVEPKAAPIPIRHEVKAHAKTHHRKRA
jgi:hypothetical protein